MRNIGIQIQILAFLPIALSTMAAVTQRTEFRHEFRVNRNIYHNLETGSTLEKLPRCTYILTLSPMSTHYGELFCSEIITQIFSGQFVSDKVVDAGLKLLEMKLVNSTTRIYPSSQMSIILLENGAGINEEKFVTILPRYGNW